MSDELKTTGAPRSLDGLVGWFMVWRPRQRQAFHPERTPVPLAAFPTKEIAEDWINSAPHRSGDFIRPIFEKPNATNEPQRLGKDSE